MNYSDAEKQFTNFKNFFRLKINETQDVDHQQKREQFATLSGDDKSKLISPQLDIYTSSVSRKSESLTTMATLAATLIVVTTLNKGLVPLTLKETKSILTIFLLLIPITLHYYIKTTEKTAINAINIIKSYHKEGIFDVFGHATFLQQLASDFPIIVVYIFYGIIFLVIFRIWFG